MKEVQKTINGEFTFILLDSGKIIEGVASNILPEEDMIKRITETIKISKRLFKWNQLKTIKIEYTIRDVPYRLLIYRISEDLWGVTLGRARV